MMFLRGAKEIYYDEGLSGLSGKLTAVRASWSCWCSVRLLDPVRAQTRGSVASWFDGPAVIVRRRFPPAWKTRWLGQKPWWEVLSDPERLVTPAPFRVTGGAEPRPVQPAALTSALRLADHETTRIQVVSETKLIVR